MIFVGVQFDIVWEDKPANHAKIDSLLDNAGIEAGSFVLLPELGDTGFSFNLDKIVDNQTLNWARDSAKTRGIWLQVGYAITGEDSKGRNCASIISPDGEIISTYEKIHPFSYSKETEHFSSGNHITLVDINGLKVCPMICYDLRFPELWRLATMAGAEVFTIGASWPAPRKDHWRYLLIARAIENQAYVVAVNRTGIDPNNSFPGDSMIISPTGEILTEAGEEQCVFMNDLSKEKLTKWRQEFPTLVDVQDSLLGEIEIR